MMIIVDVPRNERRKWTHCFENVNGVTFFIDISSHDLSECLLELAKEILNAAYFITSQISVIFTHADVLFGNLEKILRRKSRLSDEDITPEEMKPLLLAEQTYFSLLNVSPHMDNLIHNDAHESAREIFIALVNILLDSVKVKFYCSETCKASRLVFYLANQLDLAQSKYLFESVSSWTHYHTTKSCEHQCTTMELEQEFAFGWNCVAVERQGVDVLCFYHPFSSFGSSTKNARNHGDK
jgi:hypothetical protein